MNTSKITVILNQLNKRRRRVEELQHVHLTEEEKICVLKIAQGVVFIAVFSPFWLKILNIFMMSADFLNNQRF